MRKDLQESLRKELHAIPSATVSETHLKNTIAVSRMAYQKRRQLPPVRLLDFVIRQARFVAIPIWVVQGVVLLGLCLLFQVVQTDRAIAAHATLLLPVAAVFIAFTGLPFLARSFKYGMQEVEMTTRLSLSRLTLARLIVTGSGDAIALLVLLLLSFGKLELSAGGVLAYMILPFLLASAVSLFLINHLRDINVLLACGVTSLIMTGLLTVLAIWMPQDIAAFLPWIAGALCAVCAMVVALECRKLIKHMNRADFAPAPGY